MSSSGIATTFSMSAMVRRVRRRSASSGHHFRDAIGRRGVAAAADADDAIDHHHADPGQVTGGDGGQEVLAGAVLGAVDEDEVGGAADLDQAAVELALAGGVAGGKAEGLLGRDLAEAAQ